MTVTEKKNQTAVIRGSRNVASGSGNELLELNNELTENQKAELSKIFSNQQELIDFCNAVDRLRKTICFKYLESDHVDRTSPEYKKAQKLFTSLNIFFGKILTRSILKGIRTCDEHGNNVFNFHMQ